MKKDEIGITMIALVVTIVVLLIITAVALQGLDNDGVVTEAYNKTEYQKEVIKQEQNKMDKVRNEQLKDWGFYSTDSVNNANPGIYDDGVN